jgi:hypothetical protein
MEIYPMALYVVMPGCEFPAQPSFPENALFDNEADAEREADIRNETETEKGNAVTWFVSKQFDMPSKTQDMIAAAIQELAECP